DFLGVKKSLTARASVVPCSTYQLKLAIADRGDATYDSGVFISEISGGSPLINFVSSADLDYLIEDCTDEPDSIRFSFDNIQTTASEFIVTIGGTATPNVDYLLDIPATLTFEPGLNEFSFPITVLSDLLTEGSETITIELSADFGCGVLTAASLEVVLNDELDIDINAGQDTLFLCVGAIAQLETSGASTYAWSPPGLFDDPTDATPTVAPTESTWVSVTGQIGPVCIDTDSIFLQVLDPTVNIPEEEVFVCAGQSVTLTAINNTNGMNIQWFPEDLVDDPTSETVMVNAPEDGFSFLDVTIDLGNGCIATDFVTVSTEIFTPPVVTNDTTICEGFPVRLATLADSENTTYQWSPEAAFDNPNAPTPIITPTETETYTLISTSATGACTDTSSVTVTVIPGSVTILNQPDPVLLCVGESVTLNASTSTGQNDAIVWTPDNGSLDTLLGSTVVATPAQTTFYVVSYDINGCLAQDSIQVRVDSLPPDMTITPTPFEDPYCPGEVVALVSPDYNAADYPNISHQWTGPGLETADTLYNMVILTVDTATYTRVTTSGACSQTDELSINVISDEGLTLTTANNFLCPTESTQLIATTTQEGEISWNPTTGLSCTDCLEPIARPEVTTVYTVSLEIGACVLEQSVEIIVGTDPVVDLIADPIVCPDDETAPLNNAPAEVGVTYSWVADNDPAFSSNEAQPTVAPSQTTTYTLTVDNACIEPTDYSVTVNVSEPLAITDIGANQDVCLGDTFTLSTQFAEALGPNDQVNWTYDQLSDNNASVTFEATNSGPATFTYSWTSDTSLCGIIQETFDITVLEAPIITLTEDQTFCFEADGPIVLNTAPAQAGVQYNWTANGVPFSNEANPTEPAPIPMVTTDYELTAFFENNGEEQCSISEVATITIVEMASLTTVVNDVEG
ncbi:MAG: choice-of-anchor L domain-containing protein, partial [Bacteroidota bacterium]